MCRSPVQPTDVHPSTYLRRKINALRIECEWKCGAIVEIGSYDKHRYDECHFIHALQVVHQYAVGNTAVDRKSVDAVKNVLHQLPIKLMIYVLEKLHIQRFSGMEKNDMIDSLIQYADTARQQFQRLQSGDINVIYEHWTVKELKQALQSKRIDTSTMLERSELQQAAYQHNIRNKVPVKSSNKTAASSLPRPVHTPPSQPSTTNQQHQQQSTSNQQPSNNNNTSSQPQSPSSPPTPSSSPQPDTTQQQSSTQSHTQSSTNQSTSSSYSFTSVPPTGTSTGTSNCTYNFINAGGNNVYQQTFVNHNTTNVNINQSSDATPDNCAVA